MMQHVSISALLIAALLVVGFAADNGVGKAVAEDGDRPEPVEAVTEAPKTNGPAAKPEPPSVPKGTTAKPPPDFKATEEVPVDMAVDFPSDI